MVFSVLYAIAVAPDSPATFLKFPGMDMLTQSIELSRSPHIVIATPGRLADHINSGDGLKLNKVKFLVGNFGRLSYCSKLTLTLKSFRNNSRINQTDI